jgi:hypothetical protein
VETGSPGYFKQIIAPDPDGRWGTYAVQLDLPLTTDAEAEAYLRALLPELIPRWRKWAQTRLRVLASRVDSAALTPLFSVKSAEAD